MKIATWNVNSVKARLTNVLDWLGKAQPDLLLLQEIKCQDQDFPALDFRSVGYESRCHGQKSYNGVAVLSRLPIAEVRTGLPGNADDVQARYIEADIAGMTIACLYLPNGNPRPGEKFDYKLGWMQRLQDHAHRLLGAGRPFLLAGDFNICPTDQDVWSPEAFREDALCHPSARAAYRHLLNLGLTEAWRALHPALQDFTFWDYQAGAWPKNHGLRIDHFLLGPQLADRLIACEIDRGPRALDKASDHTPIWIELTDAA